MNVGAVGAVTVSAHEVARQERAKRAVMAKLIRVRNQTRKERTVIISRPDTKRVRVMKTHDGMLHHYRAAFLFGHVEYADAVRGEAKFRKMWPEMRNTR
jgi:hypothetical protein